MDKLVSVGLLEKLLFISVNPGRMLIQHEGKILIQFTYNIMVNAGQSVTPKFTFSNGAPVAKVDFGDGTETQEVVNGFEMSHTYTKDGFYTVKLLAPYQEVYLTQIDISNDHVIAPVTWPILLRLRALTRLIDIWAIGYGEVGIMKIAR